MCDGCCLIRTGSWCDACQRESDAALAAAKAEQSAYVVAMSGERRSFAAHVPV